MARPCDPAIVSRHQSSARSSVRDARKLTAAPDSTASIRTCARSRISESATGGVSRSIVCVDPVIAGNVQLYRVSYSCSSSRLPSMNLTLNRKRSITRLPAQDFDARYMNLDNRLSLARVHTAPRNRWSPAKPSSPSNFTSASRLASRARRHLLDTEATASVTSLVSRTAKPHSPRKRSLHLPAHRHQRIGGNVRVVAIVEIDVFGH